MRGGSAGDFPARDRTPCASPSQTTLRGVVSLCCIIEKEYLPFGRAALDWDIAERRFLSPPPDQGTGRQAWAYVASYLARKQLA